jgi:hypothetical protein
MIRTDGTTMLGRLASSLRRSSARTADAPPGAATVEEMALALVRHVNEGDRPGFLRLVIPTVRVSSAARLDHHADVDARRLFTHLAGLAPGQTICVNRIRPTRDTARLDVEVSWLVPPGTCVSGLGTIGLVCAEGRVTALVLDLDLDLSVARAAALLGGGTDGRDMDAVTA